MQTKVMSKMLDYHAESQTLWLWCVVIRTQRIHVAKRLKRLIVSLSVTHEMVAMLLGLGLNTFGLKMYLCYLTYCYEFIKKGHKHKTHRGRKVKEQKESFNDKLMSKVHSPNIQNASNKKEGKGKYKEKTKEKWKTHKLEQVMGKH